MLEMNWMMSVSFAISVDYMSIFIRVLLLRSLYHSKVTADARLTQLPCSMPSTERSAQATFRSVGSASPSASQSTALIPSAPSSAFPSTSPSAPVSQKPDKSFPASPDCQYEAH